MDITYEQTCKKIAHLRNYAKHLKKIARLTKEKYCKDISAISKGINNVEHKNEFSYLEVCNSKLVIEAYAQRVKANSIYPTLNDYYQSLCIILNKILEYISNNAIDKE